MQARAFRLLSVAVAVIVLLAIPLSLVDNGPSLCLIKAVSGHECPGCGMTRALMHALHGDFTRAWEFNWRWVLVAPLLFYGTVRWLRGPGRELPALMLHHGSTENPL
jgi:hypothetical protein